MNILASSNRQLCAARLGEEACVVVSRGWDRRGRARAARPTADGRDNHTRSSAGSATGSQRRLEALTSHGVGRSLEFQFQVGRFPRCPRVSAAPVTEPFPTSPNVRSVAIYFRWTESTSESDCNKVGARARPSFIIRNLHITMFLAYCNYCQGASSASLHLKNFAYSVPYRAQE